YFFHQMVFHGRILHIYYPFIIIGVLGFLQQQQWVKLNRLTAAVVIMALVNYGFVIHDFNRIGYPRDAFYKYHLFEEKGRVDFTYFEQMASAIHYNNREISLIDSTG